MLRHLLPDGAAWRVTVEKTLRKFLRGLGDGAPKKTREFVDNVYLDLFPDTTRELPEWERQFNLLGTGNDAARRQSLDAAWKAQGGQSPRYIEDILQAAGFDVYVHEWWSSGPPYVARDPRDHTTNPLIGSVQCSALASQPQCTPGDIFGQPQCNAFLANDPGYIVNRNLTDVAPPPVPDDPARWPYFLYIGAATFPNLATIPNARRAEFERLILKIKPAQQWIVTLIDFTTSGVFDSTFDPTFE